MKRFKTAYLKLTLFYVLIVMVVSIIFSGIIYRISSNEIERSLGQQTIALRALLLGTNQPMPDLDRIRQNQIEESNNRIELELIYFNLLILALSSIASYFLAKKTLEPIEEAMDAQNRFTADASHELRTPLTAMRTEIEVSLRDKKMNLTGAKVLLGSNLEEISKLESLSNALLKLARNQELPDDSFGSLQLEEILVSAYEQVESLASKKSIEFVNEFHDLMVNGDKQSLVELFVILLDNAIKYSPEKSKISIVMKKDGRQAVVVVKDQGIGIKQSDIPFIFNRFYRADSSRSKEKVTGYGLGLSIAKNIVEIHNGTITVNSKPGSGSEFIVSLPLSIEQKQKT